MSEAPAGTLTYGGKAVGLSFNLSGDDAVAQCKAAFANEIDRMNNLRENIYVPSGRTEQARLASIAITEMQTAKMWAVNALTWCD